MLLYLHSAEHLQRAWHCAPCSLSDLLLRLLDELRPRGDPLPACYLRHLQDGDGPVEGPSDTWHAGVSVGRSDFSCGCHRCCGVSTPVWNRFHDCDDHPAPTDVEHSDSLPAVVRVFRHPADGFVVPQPHLWNQPWAWFPCNDEPGQL